MTISLNVISVHVNSDIDFYNIIIFMLSEIFNTMQSKGGGGSHVSLSYNGRVL